MIRDSQLDERSGCALWETLTRHVANTLPERSARGAVKGSSAWALPSVWQAERHRERCLGADMCIGQSDMAMQCQSGLWEFKGEVRWAVASSTWLGVAHRQ